MLVDRVMILVLLLKTWLHWATMEKYSGLSISGAEVSNSVSSFKSCVVLGSTIIVKILVKGDVCKEQNWRERKNGE